MMTTLLIGPMRKAVKIVSVGEVKATSRGTSFSTPVMAHRDRTLIEINLKESAEMVL